MKIMEPKAVGRGRPLNDQNRLIAAIQRRRANDIIRSRTDARQIPSVIPLCKRPLQVIIAAMRKLLHIAFGVVKSVRPFRPEIALA